MPVKSPVIAYFPWQYVQSCGTYGRDYRIPYVKEVIRREPADTTSFMNDEHSCDTSESLTTDSVVTRPLRKSKVNTIPLQLFNKIAMQ